MNKLAFNPLFNFISPVTGRLPLDYNYIFVGNREGYAEKSLALIEIKETLREIQDASFVIQSNINGETNLLFPSAQFLDELPINSLLKTEDLNLGSGIRSGRIVPAVVGVDYLPGITEISINPLSDQNPILKAFPSTANLIMYSEANLETYKSPMQFTPSGILTSAMQVFNLNAEFVELKLWKLVAEQFYAEDTDEYFFSEIVAKGGDIITDNMMQTKGVFFVDSADFNSNSDEESEDEHGVNIFGPYPKLEIDDETKQYPELNWYLPRLPGKKTQVLTITDDVTPSKPENEKSLFPYKQGKQLSFENILPKDLKDNVLAQKTSDDDDKIPQFVNAILKKGTTWQGGDDDLPKQMDLGGVGILKIQEDGTIVLAVGGAEEGDDYVRPQDISDLESEIGDIEGDIALMEGEIAALGGGEVVDGLISLGGDVGSVVGGFLGGVVGGLGSGIINWVCGLFSSSSDGVSISTIADDGRGSIIITGSGDVEIGISDKYLDGAVTIIVDTLVFHARNIVGGDAISVTNTPFFPLTPGGAQCFTISINPNPIIPGFAGMTIPSGDSHARSASAPQGTIRFNTNPESSEFEDFH